MRVPCAGAEQILSMQISELITKMTSEDRYVLHAEWFDSQACLLRPYFI